MAADVGLAASGAMPSKEDFRRAFALFDANGDGVISLDELKAILCRPTPLQPPLSEARAEQIMRKLDTNGDGRLSRCVCGFRHVCERV